MATNVLTVPYPDELLISLKQNPDEFESEARLLLAVKLYEMGRVSTGMAARLAGMGRVAFMLRLADFGLSPLGTTANELAEDVAHA